MVVEVTREMVAKGEVVRAEVWRRPKMKGVAAMAVIDHHNMLVRTTTSS